MIRILKDLFATAVIGITTCSVLTFTLTAVFKPVIARGLDWSALLLQSAIIGGISGVFFGPIVLLRRMSVLQAALVSASAFCLVYIGWLAFLAIAANETIDRLIRFGTVGFIFSALIGGGVGMALVGVRSALESMTEDQ